MRVFWLHSFILLQPVCFTEQVIRLSYEKLLTILSYIKVHTYNVHVWQKWVMKKQKNYVFDCIVAETLSGRQSREENTSLFIRAEVSPAPSKSGRGNGIL